VHKSDKERRWWECENIKYPCGGTHVKNTKEIGMVKLKRKNLGKGKERVEIFVEGEIKKGSPKSSQSQEGQEIFFQRRWKSEDTLRRL